jgi:D-galactarolactone cycloisomerase
MRRRTFLAEALSVFAAAAAIPALSAAGRSKVKITNVQVKRVRIVKELGSVASGRAYRVGGDLITLIHTDAGLTGIGPGVIPAMLSFARERLIGADPLDVQRLARVLFNSGGAFNPVFGGANVEIALWDLVGKVLEVPLYRLWGGRDGKLMGDNFIILCDANQAGDGPDGSNSGPVRWDYKRALDTARAYERLGVYFLEEPLPRWDFDQLAQLSHAANVRIAGGEGSKGLHEYRSMLERDSLDIIQFEISVVGPTVARQITTLAAAYDKPCVAHAGFGPGVFCAGHLNASLQNAVFFGPRYGTGPTWEVFYEPPALDIDQIWSVYENAPRIDKEGYMQLPDAPGLGVTIKQDLLQDA